MESEPVVATRVLSWVLISGVLVFLFIFARRRFRQVLLIGAISIVLGDIFRLFSLGSGDAQDLIREAYFVGALAALYGVVWLGMRYRDRRRSNR